MLILSLNYLAAFFILSLMVFFVPHMMIEGRFNFALSLLVVGFINFLTRPMLLILRGFIQPFELAIFSLVINLLILNVAGGLIDDFDVNAFSAALFGAVLFSIIHVLIGRTQGSDRKLLR